MPIRLDDRTGSKELAPLFKQYGIQPELCRLEFGDLAFDGRGPKGFAAVCMERKRIDDLIDSMQSRRLSGHQLPGMSANYDYAYLVVEGIWRSGSDGHIEVSAGRDRWIPRGLHSRALLNYLMGLTLRAGLVVWRTHSAAETVDFAVSQYKMWQKPWLDHKCHDTVYSPAATNAGRTLLLRPRNISLAELMARQVPGIDDRAIEVARKFPTPRKLVNARSWQMKGISKERAVEIDRLLGDPE
jgi:ERCC4-type nuclease